MNKTELLGRWLDESTECKISPNHKLEICFAKFTGQYQKQYEVLERDSLFRKRPTKFCSTFKGIKIQLGTELIVP